MLGAREPEPDDRTGLGERSGAPGEILAHPHRPHAGSTDARAERPVRERAGAEHLARVGPSHPSEAPVHPKRPEPVRPPGFVHRPEERGLGTCLGGVRDLTA